jgi:hypothetical protein
MQEDMEKRTAQYVQVRDMLKALDEEHNKKRKELTAILESLSGIIQKFMDDHSLENLSTGAGTCYKSVRHTASLADPAAFMDYVITNNAFDLLDRRANSTAVQAFVKEHNVLPPGCNLSQIQSLGVRRKGASKSDD